ncbi:hypothetical protein [Empedobacter sp. 189-2]|uniref:hypothetical protein n=1 Tax=Empedobacter sp. 189-2 TaxID=2746724 RepID=UPI0025777CFF|nr:hypothetical protein [Empedobacter sp. 189-2]MDM1542009.1 hypothetical protein [Empedobacter sp. 189-2]
MATKNKQHDTYVIGINEENEIVFFKTYNYQIDSDEAQADLYKIQQDKLNWQIGDLKKHLQELMIIKKKWNDLDRQISKCYANVLEVDEDDLTDEDDLSDYENADLTTIGELAAIAFGYM